MLNGKIVIIFLLLQLINVGQSHADISMRRCMLLPISDSLDGVLAYKVYEELENYLRESDWCYYKSNSEILNILGNYRRNLKKHLQNKDVLKIIAEKTKAGSLIRIIIENQIGGVDLKFMIFGSNGSDLFFKEETILKTSDTSIIAQTIKNWLEKYRTTIPYDGKIVRVLGNQFTIDIGRQSGVFNGTEIKILRPTKKNRHPLLKEIVDWESEVIGHGKIIHVNTGQSQGKILEYESTKRLRIEDWALIKKKNIENRGKLPYEDSKDYQFGKLGTVSFLFELGKTSVSVLNNSVNTSKISGIILGVELQGAIWLTRNWWAGLDLSKKAASLKKEEGELDNESNSLAFSVVKFKGGYKYLPMNFFFGPKLDIFLGYGNYSYGLDTQVSDGFTSTSFKGLLMGARGDIPIKKSMRLHMTIDFLFNAKYTEEATVYGEADSTSNYSIELGVNYNYGPMMTIDAAYGLTSSNAKFRSPTREINFKEHILKLGSTFTY